MKIKISLYFIIRSIDFFCSSATKVMVIAALCVTSLQLHAQEVSVDKQLEIKHGSRLKAMFNRSTLRGYTLKIKSGEISKEEITDYIVKGGSLNQHKNYDRSKNFFIGETQYSLLNFFLKERYEPGKTLAVNRLEILSILLAAGADPNFNIESAGVSKSGNLAPILQACSGSDLDALKILHKHGGDIELKENVYAGAGGPCLAEAQTTQVLDWLLAAGGDIHYVDEYEQTLLDLAISYYGSNEKVQWLINKGVSPKVGSPGMDKLIERVSYSLTENRKDLKYFEEKAKDKNQIEDPRYSIEIEQKQIAKREALLKILAGE